MSKLSDTQRRILKAASKQPKTDVREFMGDLKNHVIRDRVTESMLKNGLIAEDPDAEALSYIITDEGFAAIGKKRPEPSQDDAAPVHEEAENPPAQDDAATAPAHKTPRKKREGSKKQRMLDMLSREEGATREQLMEATGWQRHSVQGATSTLKDELEERGLTIVSTGEGKDRVYKVVKHEPAQEAPAKEEETVE